MNLEKPPSGSRQDTDVADGHSPNPLLPNHRALTGANM